LTLLYSTFFKNSQRRTDKSRQLLTLNRAGWVSVTLQTRKPQVPVSISGWVIGYHDRPIMCFLTRYRLATDSRPRLETEEYCLFVNPLGTHRIT